MVNYISELFWQIRVLNCVHTCDDCVCTYSCLLASFVSMLVIVCA